MDRVAVFVDAGYLFAQGSVALSGRKLLRVNILLDAEKALQALADFAREISQLPLLRIYWYDGASAGPTSQHITLAHLDDVKVRLGFLNSVGEQKGVDSLIITDMIALARNRAMADAVLMSGDEDLRVGVQQAQEFGVRVHLLGIRPSRGSQSLFLLQEADSTTEWGPEDLPFLFCKEASGLLEAPAKAVEPESLAKPAELLRKVAEDLAREIPAAEVKTLVLAIRETGQTPKDLDARLLGKGSGALKALLDPSQKRELRAAFLQACESALSGDTEE